MPKATMNTQPVITAALMTPDPEVPMPNNRRKQSSFAAQISDLELGEVAFKGHAIPTSVFAGEISSEMKAVRDRLRNNVGASIATVKNRSKGIEFTTSVVHFVTPEGEMYVAAIVKRIV